MRLIEKKVKANPETFAPELLVTVAIPMELAQGLANTTDEEFKSKLGQELFELLSPKS